MLLSRNFDWVLLGGMLVLAAASLLSLFSLNPTLFSRQLVWYAIAILIITFGSRLDWRSIIGNVYFRKGLYWFSDRKSVV